MRTPTTEPSHRENLKDNRSQELIDLTSRLNEEYAQLIETSVVLRQESRVLSEESRLLRKAGFRLLSLSQNAVR